jgi:hypothetical protein
MDMDRPMVVAVKRKLKPIFLENLRHNRTIRAGKEEGNILLPIDKSSNPDQKKESQPLPATVERPGLAGMPSSTRLLQLIAYRLAAWIIVGTVHQFEGRDRAGRWHRGLCILSHDALVAHMVCWRHDASVYSDTALVEPRLYGCWPALKRRMRP